MPTVQDVPYLFEGFTILLLVTLAALYKSFPPHLLGTDRLWEGRDNPFLK